MERNHQKRDFLEIDDSGFDSLLISEGKSEVKRQRKIKDVVVLRLGEEESISNDMESVEPTVLVRNFSGVDVKVSVPAFVIKYSEMVAIIVEV